MLGRLETHLWNGLFAGTVVMLVCSFVSGTVKVTCSNRGPASEDLQLDPVHRTLQLHPHCCTKSCPPVYSRFSEARLSMQDTGNQLSLPLSWSTYIDGPSAGCYRSHPHYCVFIGNHNDSTVNNDIDTQRSLLLICQIWCCCTELIEESNYVIHAQYLT